MGILNVTPDSFSDGGDFSRIDAAVDHAKKMMDQGADFIDVGGESTRPGYTVISVEEEIARVVPVIERLRKETDALISIDTYKSKVAEAAIESGAHVINDIWGLQRDPEMIQVAAKYQVPVIVMHNQDGTEYEGEIIHSMKKFFENSIKIALENGLRKENLILDPGIGFGKTSEQNIEIMSQLGFIRELGCPVLLGTSRKSMIGKILDVPPKERTDGTVSTTVLGIVQGMDIVRVHDVKENSHAARVADAILR
nr:dihydropteroate synthase [Alkalibacter mobilis]